MNNRKYRMKGEGNVDVVLEVTRTNPRDNGSWMVCWDDGHGQRRAHITTQLPVCNSEAACQRALDQFAAKRKLEEVKPEAPHGATTNGGAWRKDLPDDETAVLMRTKDEDFPVKSGCHLDGGWISNEGGLESDYNVTGWMHLEDAARILDAAKGGAL